MKKLLFAVGMVAFLTGGILTGSSAWASQETCLQLVAYGQSKVSSLEDEALRAQVTDLLNQAQQQCTSGQSEAGIVTAKTAIDMTAQ